MSIHRVPIALLVGVFVLAGFVRAEDWKMILDQRLPEYGHRNWIVIADWAYPKQSSPGIETVYTGADHLEVVKRVLDAVDQAGHVQPILMVDAELEAVSETRAPGVDAYRASLKKLFGSRPVKALPHEAIIGRLDEASKLFSILVLKSNLTVPYTTVFIELDCGYWSAEKEAELREASGQK